MLCCVFIFFFILYYYYLAKKHGLLLMVDLFKVNGRTAVLVHDLHTCLLL